MDWHRILTPTLSLLLLAVPAAGKDLCFADTFGNEFVVQKAKRVKKTGKIFPINGYAVLVGNSEVVPISGTAVGRSDGEVMYGVTIYNLLEGTNQSVTGSWNPDSGVVTTHYDTDGDGTTDTSGQWDPIDCDTVVIP